MPRPLPRRARGEPGEGKRVMGSVRSIVVSCLLAAGACVAPFAFAPVSAVAAPQPDPVPKRWQLELRPGPLRTAVVPTEVRLPSGASVTQERAYVYFTYTVANFTGQDRLFAPAFELSNDEGEILRSGSGVPFAVTQELLRRLENPFLVDQVEMLGVLQQGEANAREGLVVWPLNDLDVNELALYAAGFSGENDTLRFVDPQTGEQRVINLRKTFEMRFATPGVLNPASDRPLRLAQRPRWIMR